jgi:hypothetical protein
MLTPENPRLHYLQFGAIKWGKILQANSTDLLKNIKTEVEALFKMGRLSAEKCELSEAREFYERAYTVAKSGNLLQECVEAILGLMRLAVEAMDREAVKRLGVELDALVVNNVEMPMVATYAKGLLEFFRENERDAQKLFHDYINITRKRLAGLSKSDPEHRRLSEEMARCCVSLVSLFWKKRKVKTVEWLVNTLLKTVESEN